MEIVLAETEDKRINPRRRVLLGGTIVLNGGFSTIDVVVRNVSNEGLRLQLPTPAPIPKRIEIHFGGQKRQAEVVWQRALTAGLRFV